LLAGWQSAGTAIFGLSLVLMAFSLKIPKRASYPILIGGSVVGCLLLLGIGETLGYLWP